MANIISCLALEKSFGSEPLFTDLNIAFETECRVGVIGPNGAGKSTLLKMLAGIEPPDGGQIIRSRGCRIQYVPQTESFTSESALDVVSKACTEAGMPPEEATVAAQIVLSKLGINEDTEASSLSGGWQKRLSIAKALGVDPDLILLDEPTNHLDTEGLEQLEMLLKSETKALVMISHDRYFLNKVCARTVEISGAYPEGYLETKGNYADHLKHRQDFFAAKESEKQTLKSKIRNDEEWMRSSPKARTTKSRSKVEKFLGYQEQLRALNSLSVPKGGDIAFDHSNRKTKILFTLKAVSVGYASPLVEGIELTVSLGDKIGILGPNGAGKSTVIKALAGELKPLSGEIKTAHDLKITYFSQLRNELDGTRTLERTLGDGADHVIYSGRQVHIMSWAKRFGFAREDFSTLVKDLSGGQLARLHIARLMLESPDILLLDEPTNDLDLYTIEVLEASLRSFAGAIVMITHDRQLSQNVCNRFWTVHEKKILDTASRDQAEPPKSTSLAPSKSSSATKSESRSTSPSASGSKTSKGSSAISPSSKKTFSYKHKFELENIEKEISSAESDLETLTAEFDTLAASNDAGALAAKSKDLELAQSKVEKLYARWQELETLKQNGS